MLKLTSREGNLVYYYGNDVLFNNALESKSEFTRKALADVILDLNTNFVIKSRHSLEKYFDKIF